ncbi:leucine-rich repeat protein [Ruminococcus sp.]
MGFLRKIAAAAVAGVLCFVGTGALPESALMLQEHVFAASEETVSETKYYKEYGSIDAGYYGDTSWESSIGYVIATESHWDDTIGNVVSNSHIRITSVSIQTRSVVYTTNNTSLDERWYASDSDIPVVGASYVDASSVVVEIPDTIDDIPVTEIGDMTVSYSSRTSGYGFSWETPRLLIPSTLSNIGGIRCTSKYDSVQIEYDGTCEQFLSQCEVHTDTPVVCTDGSFYCTNGSYYSSCDYITYSGTCAEWKAFCPAYLSDTMVKCSDGTLNPPLPTDKQYRYDRATQTATYIGGDDNTISYLNLPTDVEGYTVTAIADSVCSGYQELYSLLLPSKLKTVGDEAFLNCKNLKEIYIPSTVTSIGSHAFGFWKNSDGTYSRMNTVTIYCTEGSAAQEYAEENDLNYQIISDAAFSTITTITTTMTTTTTTTTTSATMPASTTMPDSTTRPMFSTTTKSTTAEVTATAMPTTEKTTAATTAATTTTTAKKLTIDPPVQNLLRVGNSFLLVSNVPDGAGIWYSTDTSVATVDNSGCVTIVGTGTTSIVVSYDGAMSSVTLEVPDSKPTGVLGTATLIGQMGGYQYWGVDDERNTDDVTSHAAQLTGSGQYVASWDITGDGTGTIEFLVLELDSADDNFITSDTYPDLSVTIDSVFVDGKKVDYSASDGVVNTAYYADDKGFTRIYLTDTWGASKVGKVNDLSKNTAVMQNITVTFTVDHLEQAKYLIGDVNQDGRVDIADAVLLNKACAGAVSLDSTAQKNADCNGDDEIGANDAIVLMQFLVHIITSLPSTE